MYAIWREIALIDAGLANDIVDDVLAAEWNMRLRHESKPT
jgi:hypothetical protein